MNVICVLCDNAYQGMVWMHEHISKQNVDQVKEIHWFCYDICPKDLRLELKIDDSNQRYHFYECFPRNSYSRGNEDMNKTKLFQLLRQGVDNPSKKHAIIIDSLSTLSNEKDSTVVDGVLREIYSNRRSTSNSATQLFLTLRENASLKATSLVSHLRYLATIWSTITNDTVSVKVKKSNGKIIKELYKYNDSRAGGGSGNFALVKKADVARTKVEKIFKDNLCSFKLDLTEQEKEARNAVQLPYVRSSNVSQNTFGTSDNNESNKMAETKIHYNPDDSDDWDEEDPDNDLEFV